MPYFIPSCDANAAPLKNVQSSFAFPFTFGRMVKDRRQGIAVFSFMFLIWGVMSIGTMVFEGNGNPRLDELGANQTTTELQSGGNMEGKEIRFGTAGSGLWAASTTGTSNGSVNSMHDSYTPLGGAVPLSHMMLGEVSPGGVGVGLSGPTRCPRSRESRGAPPPR